MEKNWEFWNKIFRQQIFNKGAKNTMREGIAFSTNCITTLDIYMQKKEVKTLMSHHIQILTPKRPKNKC